MDELEVGLDCMRFGVGPWALAGAALWALAGAALPWSAMNWFAAGKFLAKWSSVEILLFALDEFGGGLEWDGGVLELGMRIGTPQELAMILH